MPICLQIDIPFLCHFFQDFVSVKNSNNKKRANKYTEFLCCAPLFLWYCAAGYNKDIRSQNKGIRNKDIPLFLVRKRDVRNQGCGGCPVSQP